MWTWRTGVAAAAIVIGPACLLVAQPAADPNRPIGILLAAGDISTCDNPNTAKQKEWLSFANRTAEIIRTVIENAKKENPEIPVRVLALGDLAYDKGNAKEFECFRKRWHGFDDVLLPVPGNHEYKSPGAKHYFDNFAKNPYVHQVKGNKGYFVVNFPHADGPWRLIGLNDNFEAKGMTAEAADQRVWLKKQLDKDDYPQGCVLAFWHAPTYTSGRHGHVDYKHTSATKALSDKRPMQAELIMLYQHGASVVLNGHDHNYEQFHPHDGAGTATKLGIRAFVVGTGGAGLTQDYYTEKHAISEVLYGNKMGNQGVLKIDLFEDRYRWEFLQIEKKKEKKKEFKLPTTSDDCRLRKKPPA